VIKWFLRSEEAFLYLATADSQEALPSNVTLIKKRILNAYNLNLAAQKF
jgi:hypothetical protein